MFAPPAFPSGSEEPSTYSNRRPDSPFLTSDGPDAITPPSRPAPQPMPAAGTDDVRPPVRRQPTTGSAGVGGPQGPAPVTDPAPAARPRSRVAVGALAFLLGGVVGAGGFALGARTTDDPTPTTESTTAPISDLALPIDQIETPTTEAPPPETTTTLGANPLEPAADVAASLGPSVVQVETDRGQGSGVVYDDGRILTNHHVVAGAATVSIRTADGRVFETEVLGSDPRNDIAVLSAPGADIPLAAIGQASALQPGQLTVAIGSPFQLQQTVTAGIVSSVNRPVPNGDGTVTAMIQTDAPINPGNSGGALANVRGEVVGINTSIRTDGTGNSNVGIGFAVPIETAIEVAERIEGGQSLEAGVLGVSGSVEDADLGVPIDEVTPGSGAEAAGIQTGDRILSIDGIPVTTIGELAGLIQSNFTGEEVELEVLRGTEQLTVQATLS